MPTFYSLLKSEKGLPSFSAGNVQYSLTDKIPQYVGVVRQQFEFSERFKVIAGKDAWIHMN